MPDNFTDGVVYEPDTATLRAISELLELIVSHNYQEPPHV